MRILFAEAESTPKRLKRKQHVLPTMPTMPTMSPHTTARQTVPPRSSKGTDVDAAADDDDITASPVRPVLCRVRHNRQRASVSSTASSATTLSEVST